MDHESYILEIWGANQGYWHFFEFVASLSHLEHMLAKYLFALNPSLGPTTGVSD